MRGGGGNAARADMALLAPVALAHDRLTIRWGPDGERADDGRRDTRRGQGASGRLARQGEASWPLALARAGPAPGTGRSSRVSASSPRSAAISTLPIVYGTGSAAARLHALASGRPDRHAARRGGAGAEPCQLAVDPAGRLLVSANYNSGDLSIVPLRERWRPRRPRHAAGACRKRP